MVNHNPDEWKHDLHERFLTLPRDDNGEQPEGTLTLWGGTARDHLAYAEQICAEVWTTEFKDGKGERSYWHKRRRDNHWLDTTCGCLVGAAVGGTNREPEPRPQAQSDGDGEFIRRPSQRRSGGFIRKRNR